jgi:hypothetical protein
MKKIGFIALMLLVCTGSFSQKVKIKKNIISLDNTEVGIAEKYKNKETREEGYTYSDLKAENRFTMIKYYLGEGNLFFVMRPDFVKDTAEIKMEYLYFTLNEQNALTDLLVKKYHFFDKNGMNMNAVNEYLSAGHEPQIPKILKQIQEQKQAEQKQKQTEEELKRIVSDMNIRVADNGAITTGRGEPAGSFLPAPNPNEAISRNNPIVVKDEAGNIMANVTKSIGFDATVATYDKNTFECKTRWSYDKKNPNSYYREIAEFLALKEYLKGQRNSFLIKKAEYAEKQKEASIAKEAVLKEKTEVEGILTLKDGTEIKGAFRFDYRQTKEGKIAPEGSIADLDAGKIIFHLYQDEKGKNKIKKYGVKEVSTFYISDNEIYESVTYKGNRLKDATSGGELNVGKLLGGNKVQKFLLRMAVTEKARLYFYGDEYILMKPNSEDAVTGKTLGTPDLKKFASDCPDVSHKITDNQYGKDEKAYLQLVEDYTKCF